MVWDIAKRAAEAEGCEFPTELPPRAKKAWLQVFFMLGGHPYLLTYTLEVMGKRDSIELGFPRRGGEWKRGALLVCTTVNLQHFHCFGCAGS